MGDATRRYHGDRTSDRARLGHRHLVLLLLSTTLFAPLSLADEATEEAPATGHQDPAVELAERTLEAMGGAEAWAATRFLSFDFFGARSHHWDRYTGRHRLSGETGEGEAYVVLQDVDDRTGRVWVDGVELEGEAREEWLERAYGAWINDTYWLLMPYKLRDPGVELRALAPATLEGVTYHVLELRFGQVGLTPGDRYRAYFDPETGLMAAWAYHLEGWEEDREWTRWWWRDWSRFGGTSGGIMLSPTRVAEDGTVRELSDIAVYDHLPDSIFTSPEPPTVD